MKRCVPALLALLAFVPSAGAAATSRCTSKLSAAQVTLGDAAKLTGRVAPHTARRVRLEVRQGKRWRVAARRRSAHNGRFSFPLPTGTAATLRLRVVVPKTSAAKRATCRVLVIVISPKDGGGAGKIEAAPEFVAIYALASDQTEDPNKVAAIRATIEAVDGWFGSQTTGGVIPRWARGEDGAVDVIVIKLDHTVADYAAGDSFKMVTADLLAKGYPVAGGKQKAGVFIDVTNGSGCGVTGSDVTIVFEAACDIHPDTTSAFPFGATYLLAHELTHNFGAVPDCAPHSDGTGHVGDDPRDILYNGPGPRDWDHLMLDPGHDDYYATGRSDCPGIERSPFWTSPA